MSNPQEMQFQWIGSFTPFNQGRAEEALASGHIPNVDWNYRVSTNALIDSLANHQIDGVRWLLARGANHVHHPVNNPTMVAAAKGGRGALEILVELGHDIRTEVSKKGETVFEIALRFAVESSIEYLVAQGVDVTAPLNGKSVDDVITRSWGDNEQAKQMIQMAIQRGLQARA